MIKSILIQGHPAVTYPGVINFNSGLTAIVGPNESGKSTVLEMIAYAINGVKQLRRPAEDYKKLAVDMAFIVKNKTYRVLRSPKEVALFNADNEKLAVGTTPVNKAIIELLGYNMDVFNVSNYCRQGESNLLSKGLKATQRKALIDQTIGLTAIDQVAAELNAASLDMSREANTLRNFWNQRVPVAPEPVSLPSPAEIREQLTQVQVSLSKKADLQGKLSTKRIEPEEPDMPMTLNHYDEGELPNEYDFKTKIADMNAGQTRYVNLKAKLAVPLQYPLPPEESDEYGLAIKWGLERLNRSVEVRSLLADLERKIKGTELPTLTEEGINNLTHQWGNYLVWQEKLALLKHDKITCPNCDHSFDRLHKELEKYADVVETAKPELSLQTLDRMRSLLPNHDALDKLKVQREALVKEVIDNDQRYINAYSQHRLSCAAHLKAMDRLKAQELERAEDERQFALCWDNSEEIERITQEFNDLRVWKQAMEAYTLASREWDHWVSQCAEWREGLLALSNMDLEGQRVTLTDQLQQAVTYEQTVLQYSKDKVKYEEDMTRLAVLDKDIERHSNGTASLKDLKAAIKSHLLPSLNTVASILMTDITNGARSSVEMTEDYEIKVDGKAIEAMSGSGGTAANLALRLGLGQVLTNSVFSLFMGDEMDADMDVERSKGLMECLNGMKKKVDQVIIVTHTAPEHLQVDHWVKL